jgi:CRP/FNR family cyclic AMP-dependent transcriptional regulator
MQVLKSATIADSSSPSLAARQLEFTNWGIEFSRCPEVHDIPPDIAALRKHSILRCLGEREIAEQRARMDPCSYKAGEEILLCKDRENRFHIITQGRVEFFVRDETGKEIKLGEAGPGGFFGEHAAHISAPGNMRVRALEDVSSLALEPHEFNQLLAKHPAISADIVCALNPRLAALDQILQQTVSRNSSQEFEKTLTFGQKIADKVADTMGSWTFIIGQAAVLTVWAIWNSIPGVFHFDPYPFIFMNLALSCQAAFAAPVIMMSQNRHSAKDRMAAEIDHQVNVKAELGIDKILKRLDSLESRLGPQGGCGQPKASSG